MLIETERAKSPQRVNGENLLRRPVGEQRNGDGDQPTNEMRVAVTAVVKDRRAVAVALLFFLEPDLANATADLVRVIMGGLAQRLQIAAEPMT